MHTLNEIGFKALEYAEFVASVKADSLFHGLWEFVKDKQPVWEERIKLWRQIGFNYLIIKKLQFKRRKRDLLRKYLSIYRLYKMDVPMELISEISAYSKGYVRDIIGQTFRVLCLGNQDSCVFARFFESERR